MPSVLRLARALAGTSTVAELQQAVRRWGPLATGAPAVLVQSGGGTVAGALGAAADGSCRVPVLVGGEPWGALEVRWASPSPCEDGLATACLLAELVAGAVWRQGEAARTTLLAHQDPLTGLANRRSVDDHLHRWAHGDDAPHLGVVVCDVNGLKAINDEHGHLVGDRHLMTVAGLVAAAAAQLPDAVAGRLGGDEFVIVSPRAVPDRVQAVVAELAAAAGALHHGDGLSCGVAVRDHLVRGERSEDVGRLLLRMADAEQYRHKLTSRPAQTPAPAFAAGGGLAARPATGTTVVDAVSTILELRAAAPGSAGLLEALSHVGSTVCELSAGAAWWVSRAGPTGVWSVSCGTHRSEQDRDGQWPAVEVDATVYEFERFPSTASALAGGSFYASSVLGDVAERRVLAHAGFRSVVAAGGRLASHPDSDHPDDGTSWLVEVYGDALTPGLAAHEGLLAALTTLALSAVAGGSRSDVGPAAPGARSAR